MSKINKSFGDPSKSEDQKYLETLMADMGLEDIDDLDPKERSAWINAAKPTYKMKRKSYFAKYFNIIKKSSYKRKNILILVHPESLIEKGLDSFEKYLNILKNEINNFSEIFMYTYLPDFFINQIIEDSSDSEKLRFLYEEFLNLKSKKVHILKDDSMLAKAFKNEISEYLIENENVNIFISGGYQDLCLRNSCENLKMHLREEINEFNHEIHLYSPLVFTKGWRSKGVSQIGEFKYPSHETTYDNSFKRVDQDAWFDKMDINTGLFKDEEKKSSIRKYFKKISSDIDGRGCLIPIGGAEKKESSSRILRNIFDISGGKGCKIIIVPSASSINSAGEDYLKIFKKLGADAKIKRPTDSDFIDSMNGCSSIFFTGGDQNRLANIISKNNLKDVILSNYLSGMNICGSSAGAAYISKNMISGGDERSLTIKNGLGALDNIIIDQHFTERKREGRLIEALKRNPESIGIGIDEDTSISIFPDYNIKVFGSGKIFIFYKTKRVPLKEGQTYNLNNLLR